MKNQLLALGLIVVLVLAFASPAVAAPPDRQHPSWMERVAQWLLPWMAPSESSHDTPQEPVSPLPDSPPSDLTSTSTPQDSPPGGEGTPIMDPDG